MLPGLTPFRSLLCECLGIGMFFFFCLLAFSGEQNEGIGKLYGDVQSCGYQDVHVMWQLLHQSSSEVSNLQLEEDEVSKTN